jgi:hypothetical protein
MQIEHIIRIESGEVKITHRIEGGGGAVQVAGPVAGTEAPRSAQLGESVNTPLKTSTAKKDAPAKKQAPPAKAGNAAPAGAPGITVVIGPVIVISGAGLSGLGEGGGGEFGDTGTEGRP